MAAQPVARSTHMMGIGIRFSIFLLCGLFVAPASSQEPPKPEAQSAPAEEKKDTRKPVSPWKRFPRNVLADQKAIWTSPFHTSQQDAKWWALFGSATAGLLATDKWTSKALPNTSDQIAVSRWTSRIGAAYSLVPIAGAFYFAGTFSKNERFRETGILGAEALANTFLVENILKTATQRERPLEGQGNGEFFQGRGRIWNSGASFPSGHAINSWALASVIAHQYPHPRVVPILSYGLASTVVASRFAVRKHFASDVVVGAAMGWFIGDYVYGKRHNRELDPKPSKLKTVLARIHVGQ
jgi:membrane-associated phospholipid phosphatase